MEEGKSRETLEHIVSENSPAESMGSSGELRPDADAANLSRRDRKALAREELREMARETKADKKQRRMEHRQQKFEEKEKYPTGHLRRKARRLRWKREKAARREELKRRYQDAPWISRVCRLYLLKPFIALLIIAALAGCGTLLAQTMIGTVLMSYMDTNKNKPVAKEEIYKKSPIDKEGAKRIDAIAPVNANDTWTICVYIVGSNLEDMGENDLSSVVRTQVEDIYQQRTEEASGAYKNRLKNFSAELEKNDLEIPSYLFYPVKPVINEDYGENSSGETVAEDPGCASNDIAEMTDGVWSDNIRLVIQTGGATRWSNTMVNPNRTQRFLYHKGVFSEVDDQPLQDVTDPKTLTSFLNFCKDEYPADHTMLVLWDHGGGAFGYGMDSIYGGMMSLADIREGLEGACEPDRKDPAFDIIGFDACLMSSLEVAHALDGFASYFAVSAETEPGDGWDYAPWLKTMTNDPTLSPAKVSRKIADSYMNYYMTQNCNIGWIITSDVTFSVLDAKKTEALYDAWCDLTKQQLVDAAADSSVLAEIGRCSNKSTHFASSAYNVYNTIDLGSYVDLMADTYPKECSRIKKLIGESVLYHRENGSLSDSQGISVYLPGSVNSYGGLAYCLDYVYNICDDPATRALYYYKIAGCLNEDMQEYLATLTDQKAQTLDRKPFRQFMKTEPVMAEDGFDIPVGENLQNMLQSYELEAAFYDEEAGSITNYGRDETVRLDGEDNMNCEFDGTWICYDGVPLATEVTSATDSVVEYRSKVLYNNKESYLCFTWDRDAEEFTINGIRGASDLAGGLINMDPFNYLINSKMNTELQKGDRIVPLYEVSVSEKNDTKPNAGQDPQKGKEIKVSKRSKISVDKLPDGYYLTSAVVSDQRGDVYYSQVVGNHVSGGKVKSREMDSDFIGREY